MNENNRYREEEKEQDVDVKDNQKIKEDEVTLEEDSSKKVDEEVKEEHEEHEKKSKVRKLHEKIDSLEEHEKELLQQIASLKNEMLKDRAELENFKRRTNDERIKERKYANQDFFLELINILDVFDKAVNVKTDDEKLKKYLIGFSMVNNQLNQILGNYGVKKIEAVGKKFDPAYHAAMETIETEDTEDGIILEEVMAGYLYKDRVLRPSMVKVSAKKINNN